MDPMPDEPRTLVLVMHAWREGLGIRGRVIFGDAMAEPRTVTCGSLDEICEVLRSAMRAWAASG
jgi:hypothetical protein